MEISQAYLMRVGNSGYGSGWKICANTRNASIQALNKFETQQSFDIDKFEIKRRSMQDDKIGALTCMYSSFGNTYFVRKENIGLDATGRTNYSVHGYIIDDHDADEFYGDVASAMAAMPFRTFSEEVRGNMSETVTITDIGIDPVKTLMKYNISADVFVNLMRSVYGCIYASGKQQPLVINLGSAYSEDAAIAIMSVIYRLLPIQLRKKLSFSTYYVHDASHYDICFTNEDIQTYNNFNIATGASTGEANDDDIVSIIADSLAAGKYETIDKLSQLLNSYENYIEDYKVFIEVFFRWCQKKNVTENSPSQDMTKLCGLNYRSVDAIVFFFSAICDYLRQSRKVLDDQALVAFGNFIIRCRNDALSEVYHKYLGYHVAATGNKLLFRNISEYEFTNETAFNNVLSEIKKYGDFNGFVDCYYLDFRMKNTAASEMSRLQKIYVDVRERSGSEALLAKAKDMAKMKMAEYLGSYKTVMSDVQYYAIFDNAKFFGFASDADFKSALVDCYWRNFSFAAFDSINRSFYMTIPSSNEKYAIIESMFTFMSEPQSDKETAKVNADKFNNSVSNYLKKNHADSYLASVIRKMMAASISKDYVYCYTGNSVYYHVYRDPATGAVDCRGMIQCVRSNVGSIVSADNKLASIFKALDSKIDKKEKKSIGDFILEINQAQQRSDILAKTYVVLTGSQLPSYGEDNACLNILRGSLSVLVAVLSGMIWSLSTWGDIISILGFGAMMAGCLFLIVFTLIDIKNNPKHFISSVVFSVVSLAAIFAISFASSLVSLIIAGSFWLISFVMVIISLVSYFRDN